MRLELVGSEIFIDETLTEKHARMQKKRDKEM